MGFLEQIQEQKAQASKLKHYEVFYDASRQFRKVPKRLPDEPTARQRVEHALYWDTFCPHKTYVPPPPGSNRVTSVHRRCQKQWCVAERELLQDDLLDMLKGIEDGNEK